MSRYSSIKVPIANAASDDTKKILREWVEAYTQVDIVANDLLNFFLRQHFASERPFLDPKNRVNCYLEDSYRLTIGDPVISHPEGGNVHVNKWLQVFRQSAAVATGKMSSCSMNVELAECAREFLGSLYEIRREFVQMDGIEHFSSFVTNLTDQKWSSTVNNLLVNLIPRFEEAVRLEFGLNKSSFYSL
jgi:hypothetical protein